MAWGAERDALQAQIEARQGEVLRFRKTLAAILRVAADGIHDLTSETAPT